MSTESTVGIAVGFRRGEKIQVVRGGAKVHYGVLELRHPDADIAVNGRTRRKGQANNPVNKMLCECYVREDLTSVSTMLGAVARMERVRVSGEFVHSKRQPGFPRTVNNAEIVGVGEEA